MKLFTMLIMMIMMFMPMISMLLNLIPSHNKYPHPLMMSLILMMFTLMNSLNISTYMQTQWMSFIMFLILIGGMMILFLYFTSFINNMKMTIKLIHLNLIPMKYMIFFIMLIIFFNNLNINFNWINNYNEIMNLYYNQINNSMYMYMYMYMYNKNYPTLISLIYLLFTLTLIVKICLNKKFSIRKIN